MTVLRTSEALDPFRRTRTVTFVAPVAGRTSPHSEKPWPRLETVSGTGQPKYSGLGLPLTYSRPVWKPTTPPWTLDPGAPPSGSSLSRYWEKAARGDS